MELIVSLALAAFVTSALTAAMGVGGGVLLLALMAQLLPPQLLITLHGAAQLMSNTNRALMQRRHVNWAYLRPFMLGCLLGAVALAPIAMWLPTHWGQFALGAFILLATWKPQWLALSAWRPSAAGASTTGLSLVLGATGPLVMSVLPKQNWSRQQVVGTHAMAMTVQHGLKVLVLTGTGVELWAHWPLLLALGLATLLGNVLGAKLLNRIPEARFKTLLNGLLTLLALRLIWVSVRGF
jgi:uncharacterized protein